MAKAQPQSKAARRSAGAADRDTPQRTIVTVSVDTDLLRRFDVMARREARTRSSQIALLMRRWVEGESLEDRDNPRQRSQPASLSVARRVA